MSSGSDDELLDDESFDFVDPDNEVAVRLTQKTGLDLQRFDLTNSGLIDCSQCSVWQHQEVCREEVRNLCCL